MPYHVGSRNAGSPHRRVRGLHLAPRVAPIMADVQMNATQSCVSQTSTAFPCDTMGDALEIFGPPTANPQMHSASLARRQNAVRAVGRCCHTPDRQPPQTVLHRPAPEKIKNNNSVFGGKVESVGHDILRPSRTIS